MAHKRRRDRERAQTDIARYEKGREGRRELHLEMPSAVKHNRRTKVPSTRDGTRGEDEHPELPSSLVRRFLQLSGTQHGRDKSLFIC